MCLPIPPQQQQPQITDTEVSPDGGSPLLIQKTKPEAPPGYVARFIEGKWRIIPDPFQGRNTGGFGNTVSGPTLIPGNGGGGGGGGNGGGGGGRAGQ